MRTTGARATGVLRGCALAATLAAALAAAQSAALAGTPQAAAADPGAQDLRRVEAAFLRNFARYVSWPETAFRDAKAPWQIGVLGRDALADALERTLQGRTEQERPFEVRRARSAEALRDCHIVFVGFEDPVRRRAALAELKGRPILTVGDAEGFLEDGGTVQLIVRDTVQFSVNLDQARAGALRIQTKMLEISRAVFENGVTRALR
jgi:hypothetical protein